MSLDQIQAVVAIAEEGSVRRAAERLHITQPPLSRQVLQLEDELGVQLFARSGRGMTLLPAGERFVEAAREVLAAVAVARRAVLGGEGGAVRLGEGGARGQRRRGRHAEACLTAPGRAAPSEAPATGRFGCP